VRRLLRQTKSKLWVSEDGSLTKDLGRATDIEDVAHALRLCRKHNLRGMELVLKFEAEEYDVTLPLGDVC
jgi:hypothetical protein